MSQKMERVGSSAMKSLAAYADSDEEDELSKESGGIESDDDAERLDSGHRHRTLSTAEIANARLPEAPDSFDEDEGSDKDKMRKRVDSEDEDSAEFRKLPLISADDEYENDSRLVEPPPPARPKTFQSPSPSSSRGSTPQVVVTKALASAMPRLPSSQALVSYQAEDDEEFHHRLSAEEPRPIPEPRKDESKGVDRSQKSPKCETATEEIDVDELLDKRLENAAAAMVDSPGEVLPIEASEIPPAPEKKCSKDLQAKFQLYLQRKQSGVDFNAAIQNRTDFRNPSIYQKLIEHFGIDEIGTNFPKQVYDPHGFKPSDYYEEISKAQRALMEKGMEKEAAPKPAPGGGPDEKKRKTKWDK